MNALPENIQKYLTVWNDTLARGVLLDEQPELAGLMDEPNTRQTLLDWLAGSESLAPQNARLTANALQFLRPQAQSSDAPIVRKLLMHPDAIVRLRTYEFLLTLYFPDKNPEALIMLLNSMLMDADDTIRTQGVRYIQRANAVTELRDFLVSWQQAAAGRGWLNSESYELVQQLLNT
ncbi:MAG: hypothetical protein KDE54_11140 [Caldilineaceae bacterium]|nr:hypothetical protein [Caldilineaceae bacterium]MCB0144044.1 hypothetical protein [Caldilineaceae bacterium]